MIMFIHNRYYYLWKTKTYRSYPLHQYRWLVASHAVHVICSKQRNFIQTKAMLHRSTGVSSTTRLLNFDTCAYIVRLTHRSSLFRISTFNKSQPEPHVYLFKCIASFPHVVCIYCPELLTWQGGVSIRTIAFRLWVKYVLRSQSVLVVHYSCNIHVPTISRVSCDFHTPFQW